MECNKLGLGRRFLKVRAKVTGFLIAKIEKRNTTETEKYNLEKNVITIKSKKNTITGLPYLLNAFQTYMSGATYFGQNAPSPGIVINTSSGQQITLSFVASPAFSPINNSLIISFTVIDDTTNSYTAVSEELITESAGYNIPIATTNLSITKNSDEILTMTWIITISVSPSGDIIYIPTLTPQGGGCSFSGVAGSCFSCIQSSANSQLSNQGGGCSPYGLSSQYPQSNFIVSTLFTDMFYNTYGKGSSNALTSYINTTLYIYTPYCMEYFAVGIFVGSPAFTSYQNGTVCYIEHSVINPIYLQVYSPSETAPYIGVQIEFTT